MKQGKIALIIISIALIIGIGYGITLYIDELNKLPDVYLSDYSCEQLDYSIQNKVVIYKHKIDTPTLLDPYYTSTEMVNHYMERCIE